MQRQKTQLLTEKAAFEAAQKKLEQETSQASERHREQQKAKLETVLLEGYHDLVGANLLARNGRNFQELAGVIEGHPELSSVTVPRPLAEMSISQCENVHRGLIRVEEERLQGLEQERRFTSVFGMDREAFTRQLQETLGQGLPYHIEIGRLYDLDEKGQARDGYHSLRFSVQDTSLLDPRLLTRDDRRYQPDLQGKPPKLFEGHLMWFPENGQLVIEKTRASRQAAGRGLGKIVARNILDQAGKLGAKEVALFAGEEDGQLFWAKAGFLPAAETGRTQDWMGRTGELYYGHDDLKRSLKSQLEFVKIPDASKSRILESLERDDPEKPWLWEIADDKTPLPKGKRSPKNFTTNTLVGVANSVSTIRLRGSVSIALSAPMLVLKGLKLCERRC